VAHVKGKHFSHPTGKPLVHFIEEYFLKNRDKTATWGELSHLSISLGFSKSSINNAITRLQERKIIERVGSGTYKLSDKKTQKSA
jgi:DNA-binding transcriptional regulator PaaX